MRTSILTTVVLAALLAVIFPGVTAAANWVLMDENDDSSFYYDKSATTKPETGKVRVKARAIYTDEGKGAALKVLGRYKNMETLSESQYTYDLDCAERQSHLMDVTHLDKDGKTLRSSNLGGVTGWEEILPDTRISLVYDEVCPQ